MDPMNRVREYLLDQGHIVFAPSREEMLTRMAATADSAS